LLLATASAIGLTIKYMLFFVILARPAYGAIRVELRYFSLHKLKEIVRFGVKSFIQGISTRIETSTDAIIIGYFLGPAMVPFYSVPANLVQYLRTLGWTLTHAFMPLFSDMSARLESERIREVYLRSSKYVVGIVFPMAVGVLFVGGPFLSIWIGPEFREKGEVIIFLMVLFILIPFVNPFASRYLTAIGEHGIFARLTPIAAAINVSLSLILIKPYGIVGVAAASTVSVFIFVPIYLRYTCKQLEMPVSHYLRQSVFPTVIPTVLLGVVVAGFRSLYGLDSYLMIVLAALCSGLVWLFAFWLVALDNDERQFVMVRIRRKNRG